MHARTPTPDPSPQGGGEPTRRAALLAASRLRIVPAEERHCRALAANLRPGDRAEVQAAGMSSIRAVAQSFRGGLLMRTAFVDGEIAAMWGLGGTLISDVGHPWLLTAPPAARLPLAFVKNARRELAAMLALRRILRNWVAADYDQAIGLLRLLGFTLHPPAPWGPKGHLFREFEMVR